MDKQTAAESEEFYDHLVTCDIKSVDCLIASLVVEPNVIQKLKGELIHYAVEHSHNDHLSTCDGRVTGSLQKRLLLVNSRLIYRLSTK